MAAVKYNIYVGWWPTIESAININEIYLIHRGESLTISEGQIMVKIMHLLFLISKMEEMYGMLGVKKILFHLIQYLICQND